MKKYETAMLLKDLGFSHLQIAAELYPRDYERYRRTRDPKLRELLKRRVWKLLRLARERGGPNDYREVDHSGWWPQELDDSGGERDRLSHRAPLVLEELRKRKASAADRFERQLVEYEQYLYMVYEQYLARRDPGGLIWGTARSLHYKVFKDYYEKYKVNVWNKVLPRRGGSVARAYVYSVLAAAGLVVGVPDARWELARVLEPDRRLVSEIAPLVWRALL